MKFGIFLMMLGMVLLSLMIGLGVAILSPGTALISRLAAPALAKDCKLPNVARAGIVFGEWKDRPLYCPEHGLCWQETPWAKLLSVGVMCLTQDQHEAALRRGADPSQGREFPP